MSNIVNITKESGIPLLGLGFIGIICRNNNNMIQIRTTTVCNMNCTFCSTDAGPFSKFHKTNFVVDLDYLLEYLQELANYFNTDLNVHLDSVGEPLAYPQLVELIKGIRKIKNYKDISIVTNGTLLNKKKIQDLDKAGLTRLNLSFHSINVLKSKELFGSKHYNIDAVIENIKELQKTNIDFYLAPVFIPSINDKDIEEIIEFGKEQNCKVLLQKFEHYKHGRKVKAKEQSYSDFYKTLKNLEKKHKTKLRYDYSKLETKKVKPLPIKFKKNDKVSVEIKSPGWFSNQSIGVAGNRAITILNHKADVKGNLKVKIIEAKSNIYLAEPVKRRIRF
tara:strand:- start:3953 stop:4954 length:1002 start_codon:yes stop_codon:yes gene_type:complete